MVCFLFSTYLLFYTLHLLERERERERSVDLTTAVTAATAATTTAATLVMSTCPQIKPRAQALLVGGSCAIILPVCHAQVRGLPRKAVSSVGLLRNARPLCRGLRDFAFLKSSYR